MANRSFKQFVEQVFGVVPKFIIYALLEWVMIMMLLIEGFVAFLANEFSNFFELPVPCLICTRIDQTLVCRMSDSFYKDSICENHKKKFSSLAFCHVHKKLSDIRNMCETCLLSFVTEKESDCDKYKSLLGILHKGVDLFVDEDRVFHLSFPGNEENPGEIEVEVFNKSDYDQHCSCCGQTLNVKLSVSDTKSKNNSVPSLLMDEDEDDWKSPNFMNGNKFFGNHLSDLVTDSPRWRRSSRKPLFLDRTESAIESREVQVLNNEEGDILHNLKRQVRLGRKSLMALYMELDEERSASAIAAKNAMAMITRLQAEKAVVQMEALQYQRMMEEQAEYDEEALQALSNLVVKREEEIRELMEELEKSKRKYECSKEVAVEE